MSSGTEERFLLTPQISEEETLIRPQKKNFRHILKNGSCTISPAARPTSFFLHFSRIVNSPWSSTIALFIAILLFSWLFFAALWWLICYSHGDFEPNHLPAFQALSNHTPCVFFIHDFSSCFLFSIETQHTVGYGIKAPSDECPEAIFVNVLQCLIGYAMQGIMSAIIFSKMTLPRLRSQTLLFTEKAVVCPWRNGLGLRFRIGDMRKSLVGVSVKVFYVKTKVSLEGEVLCCCQREMGVEVDGCVKDLFFNFPLEVVHAIGVESPLYRCTPEDLRSGFEIVVVLEGTVQSTGQSIQARSSFLPVEILWGFSFKPLVRFDSDRRIYDVDFSLFNEVESVGTPFCSALELSLRSDDDKRNFLK